MTRGEVIDMKTWTKRKAALCRLFAAIEQDIAEAGGAEWGTMDYFCRRHIELLRAVTERGQRVSVAPVSAHVSWRYCRKHQDHGAVIGGLRFLKGSRDKKSGLMVWLVCFAEMDVAEARARPMNPPKLCDNCAAKAE